MKKSPVGDIHQFSLDGQKSTLVKILFMPDEAPYKVIIGVYPRALLNEQIDAFFSPHAPHLDFSEAPIFFVGKKLIQKLSKVASQPLSEIELSNIHLKDLRGQPLDGNLLALGHIREAAEFPFEPLPGGIQDDFTHSLYSAKVQARLKATMP